MMRCRWACLFSAAALIGIDAMKVTVEANVAGGIPSFTVVCLINLRQDKQPSASHPCSHQCISVSSEETNVPQASECLSDCNRLLKSFVQCS